MTRIAYLVSRYPSVTIAFVVREVRALRSLGLSVETMSVRRVGSDQLLSAADREEYAGTFNVRPVGPVALLVAHARALRASPAAYLSTLARAVRLSPGGLRGGLWQLFYFAQAMRVWSHCRDSGARHLHVHFANVSADIALLVVAFAARAHPEEHWRWSFTLHGPTEFSDVRAHRLAEKARSAEFVACTSDYARSQLMAIVPEEHWDKLHMVRLGVDPAEFDRAPRSPGRPPRILSVGQLQRRKGHALLLHALKALREEHGVLASLVIVGEGPERARLATLARTLGLEDAVTFTGALGQDDIREHYRAADCFCLASFAEGQPVVFMEAMAMRVPSVGTRIMGVPELIEDGVTGVLVSPGQPAALAAGLARVLLAPEWAAELAERGRERVLRDYDLRANVEALARLMPS